jgi:prepilin-type N-terminal cleavage/methylation domain-containing protein
MLRQNRVREQRGTTLIELMIAMALTGIITLVIMKTYVTQHENYLTQDDVATMQQSSRACLDEMTRQIRMAGHKVPMGLDPLVADDADPDTITVVYQGEDVEAHLTVAMANTSSPLQCNDVTDFKEGDWVYIYDPDSAQGEWLQVSAVQTGGNTLLHQYIPTDLSRRYPVDAIVVVLEKVKFFVDDQTDPANPSLMVQRGGDAAEIYADRISDLQFRYRLANGSVVNEPILLSDVREVLIDVTALSNLAEERAKQDAGGDPKGRTYSSSVSLRNF